MKPQEILEAAVALKIKTAQLIRELDEQHRSIPGGLEDAALAANVHLKQALLSLRSAVYQLDQ